MSHPGAATRPLQLLPSHHLPLNLSCLPRRMSGPAPCMSYSGKHAGLDVHVVWNGRDAEHGVDLVGTVPASLSTYLACQAFNPDLIISAGTAGGFKAKVRPATQRT